MIDVTFQLLIFFILCTRFASPEKSMSVELPDTEGLLDKAQIPKERLTIYCVWDQAAGANSYVLALEARGRIPVENSYARLDELVVLPSDTTVTAQRKRARYEQVHHSLVDAMRNYLSRSGAGIAGIEIAFAVDSTVGAAGGTAPWLFVCAALDGAAAINRERPEPYSVTFKFVDALGRYRG